MPSLPWEAKVERDNPLPDAIRDVRVRWREKLDLLTSKDIPCCYFSKTVVVVTMELHGFSDPSEEAYAGLVYLRVTCEDDSFHTVLVSSKTKGAPIKRVSIPHLELCGAVIVTQLLKRVQDVLRLPLHQVPPTTSGARLD